MGKGKIYMLPTPIGDTPVWDVLPQYNRTVIDRLEYFIVENTRSARRFLSRAGIQRPIDSLRFAELNEHSTPEAGADLAALAHLRGVEVVPLVGPSSILLALMASGLNGQSFAFNGYLPVKQPERGRAIRHFEKRAQTERQSQIFIETPYRNLKLFEDFLKECNGNTLLTVAADILQPDQLIRTAQIRDWKAKTPDIHKRPAIFILGV